MTTPARRTVRSSLLRRARLLEWVTVGWNLAEGSIAIAAAAAAGSVALLGFGLDSFVELASGLVILWRLAAERRARDEARVERVEDLARRGVAVSLWLLAGFVASDATASLLSRERPSTSAVGLILLVVSVGVMRWLGAAKRAVAVRLHSHAIEADAAQTDICWQLSVVALLGLGANAAFDWWWADPVAGLGLAILITREGVRAWERRTCC